MKTLVIGYGNPSRRDDGAGRFVIEQLQGQSLSEVDLISAHQLEVEIAEVVGNYDTVIFVDASVPESPHAVTRATVKPEWQSHAVSHYLTPNDVLALSHSLYGKEPHGMLFSIRGHDFDFGDTLSAATEEAARGVVREIRQLLPLLQRKESIPVIL